MHTQTALLILLVLPRSLWPLLSSCRSLLLRKLLWRHSMCWEALDRAGSAATLRAKGRIWETLQDAHSSASCTRPAAAAASFFANTALTTLPIDLQGAVQHTESHTLIIPTQDGLLKSVSRPFWQLEQDNQSPLVVFGVGRCTCPFLGLDGAALLLFTHHCPSC